jgi:SAM-dependent methyltransferase
MEFSYDIDTTKLNDSLKSVVVNLSPDIDLDNTLKSWQADPYPELKMLLYPILQRYIPLFTLDALLGVYPLYILGPNMWQRIVPKEKHGGSLLDIGAGQGFVTMNAKPIFKKIVTTETSIGVAIRLWFRGFVCKLRDVARFPRMFRPKSFDVVSILNVIDRSDRPISLLENARNFLKDDGYMIIATPLPIHQVVWTTKANPVQEHFNLSFNSSFEESLNELCEKVLIPHGLVPTMIGKLPYISKPNYITNLDPYEDAIIVCKKVTRQ